MWRRTVGLVALAACVATGTGRLAARSGQQPEQAPPPPPPQLKRVALTAGRSTVVLTDFDIARIAVTNPAVADAVVVQPREILIDGKSPGTVSLIVWGSTQREQYDLVVEQGVPNLQRQFNILFPGEDIHVSASDDAIILSGQVSNNAVMLRAGEIAQASASKAKVINMLQLPGGSESQQVMLQVRFAEVNRRALTELGANLFMTRQNAVGRATTQQFAAPGIQNGQTPQDPQDLVFSDFLNLFFFQRTQGDWRRHQGARSSTGSSRASPSRTSSPTTARRRASWPAAKFPCRSCRARPARSRSSTRSSVIRLTFKPTIAGDVIRLKVRPEVSTLDFANGITLSGFRIPALSTRRAETDVELRDGQSFAIAGLLDNLTQEQRLGNPDPEQAADHRQPVQEQVRQHRAHRADGAHHAAARAAARSRRGAAAADAPAAVPAAARARAGRRRRLRRGHGGRAVEDLGEEGCEGEELSTMRHVSSERGAILINTALTLLVWFGIATFVVDYGVMWVSRHQAQNAADAAALSGAIARAYDDFDDPPDPIGRTAIAATSIANANPVWNAGATSSPCRSRARRKCWRRVAACAWTCTATGKTEARRCRCGSGKCLASGHRGAKATASAQAMIANGTDCLRPWAIPDAWTEGSIPAPRRASAGTRI